uniref:Cwf15/Cwc15 cell cycle control protein n=1 Tax=Phytophthora ramorum TaxID=164328 RepID=H3GKM6_PHYRM
MCTPQIQKAARSLRLVPSNASCTLKCGTGFGYCSQVGQGTANEVELLDLREELERKEDKYEVDKGRKKDTAQDKLRRLEENKKILLLGDAEADARESQLKKVASKYDDADDGADSDAFSDSDSDSSDDEDEEAELMRELEKIKQEREEERLRKEEEERKAAEMQSRDEVLQGNPLTQQQAAGSAKMKRRWNDDVVFKNQSRNEPEVKKRFINDTIRNDFHRRFLNKYIQ